MKKEHLLTGTGTELTLAEGKTKLLQHSTPLKSTHIKKLCEQKEKQLAKSFFIKSIFPHRSVSHDHITLPLYSVCFKLIQSHQNHFTENSVITEVITNYVKHTQLFIATTADI